jgi:hypothetical protein
MLATKYTFYNELSWLVVSIPLSFYSVAVIIPNICENKIHVPNHQPASIFS